MNRLNRGDYVVRKDNNHRVGVVKASHSGMVCVLWEGETHWDWEGRELLRRITPLEALALQA